MKFKYLLIVITMLLVTGCGNESDSIKFKNEYEKYNKDGYIDVFIDEDNIFQYASNEKIKEIMENGTGVIFIGGSQNNLSRSAINVMIKVIENTDINVIHYSNDVSSVSEYIDEDVDIPVVLFVIEGKIDSYHMGTINDKEELSNDEEIELYNIYLDGVHKVLNDVCDERC